MQEFSILRHPWYILLYLTLCSKLKHPNIVSTLGLYEDPQSSQQFIVAELYPLGNLRNVLISEQASLTLGDLIRMYLCTHLLSLFSSAKGIAAGCAYLAEAKVVHRDLAARNVLVGNAVVEYWIGNLGYHTREWIWCESEWFWIE